MKESDIHKSIIDYLRLRRCLVFKHHSTGFTVRDGKPVPFKYGDKGVCDPIACLPTGQFLAIEVKRPGNKPTEEQGEFIKNVIKHNGIGLVAYSLDGVITSLEA